MKNNVNEMEVQATNWKKIYEQYIFDRELISRICKKTPILIIRAYDAILKWVKDFNRFFTNDLSQMASKHMKTDSTIIVIREIRIKTTVRY